MLHGASVRPVVVQCLRTARVTSHFRQRRRRRCDPSRAVKHVLSVACREVLLCVDADSQTPGSSLRVGRVTRHSVAPLCPNSAIACWDRHLARCSRERVQSWPSEPNRTLLLLASQCTLHACASSVDSACCFCSVAAPCRPPNMMCVKAGARQRRVAELAPAGLQDRGAQSRPAVATGTANTALRRCQ